MTTIAFDGRYLVADGRSTVGNLITGKRARKIWPVTIQMNGLEYQAVFAGAGSYQSVNMAREHLEEEDFLHPKSIPEMEPGSFSGLVVVENGECYVLEDRLVPMEQEWPVAIGSGTDYAMAAMTMGKSAIDAVRVACELDVYSGGQVIAFDTHSMKEVDLKEVA